MVHGNTCSAIASETSFSQNMVLEFDKQSCMRCSITLQENIDYRAILGPSVQTSCRSHQLRRPSIRWVTINGGFIVNPSREIHALIDCSFKRVLSTA